MTAVKKKKKIDFTEGPLFWRLVIFMLPIIANTILQHLYNSADKIVVGQFSGDPNALAAIGSTTFIPGLIINFMVGVTSGAGVLVARAVGAKDKDEISKTSHNALILGASLGLILMTVGLLISDPMLRLLGTNPEVFDNALLYLRLIFLGVVGTGIYNAGGAILRANGDSFTTLRIGIAAGLLNVLLNLFFVIVCGMSVAGVAIATSVAKYFSATCVLIILRRRRTEAYTFSPKKLIPHKSTLLKMMRLGIPTGLQSTCFSITNLASTAAINSFGNTAYVAARTISGDIDSIISAMASALTPAAMNATGQNAGAKKPDRIRKVLFYLMLQGGVTIFVTAQLMKIFAPQLALLFIDASDPNLAEKVNATVEWVTVMLSSYFLAGLLNPALGVIRGLGYSLISLWINIICTCGVRFAWIYLVFYQVPEFHTFPGLALMYPVSWPVAALAAFIVALLVIKHFRRKIAEEEALASADDPGDTPPPEDSANDPTEKSKQAV